MHHWHYILRQTIGKHTLPLVAAAVPFEVLHLKDIVYLVTARHVTRPTIATQFRLEHILLTVGPNDFNLFWERNFADFVFSVDGEPEKVTDWRIRLDVMAGKRGEALVPPRAFVVLYHQI